MYLIFGIWTFKKCLCGYLMLSLYVQLHSSQNFGSILFNIDLKQNRSITLFIMLFKKHLSINKKKCV